MGQRSADGGTVHRFNPRDDHDSTADLAARAVLVGILDSEDQLAALHAVQDVLDPEDFRILAHQKIFRTICELSAEGRVDQVGIATRLSGDQDVTRRLAVLDEGIPRKLPAANIAFHARTVREEAGRRRLSERAGIIARSAQNGATEQDLAAAVKDLSEVWSPRDTVPRAVNLYSDQVKSTRPEIAPRGRARGRSASAISQEIHARCHILT